MHKTQLRLRLSMAEAEGLVYRRLRLESFDPDELKTVVDGTEFEHTLLPGGRQHVDYQQLKLGTCTLQSGLYGMETLAEGCFPRQRVTIGFALEAPEPIQISGWSAERHSVQLYAENAELSYRSVPDTAWAATTIERETLQEASLRLTGRPLPLPRAGNVSLDLTPEVGERFASRIRATLAAGAEGLHPERAAQPGTALEEQLLYDMCMAVHSRRVDDRESRIARNRARQTRIMKRAEEYFRANLSESFSLADLAEATGVSPRTVEYHLRRAYGMPPKRFFLTKKLNRVHDELRRRGKSDTRVTDLALDWGFQHLGRFSVEYRRLFGENPSETLRR